MSQNHPTDNIYNILDTLKALEPTPAETVKAQAQQIRESVESQGSILKGLREVSDVEQRLSKMFTETKKVSESQGVAEGHADQQREIFMKNGKPVGEVGIDPEASPGNDKWYVKHYASGYDVVGFASSEEAVAELEHCMEKGVTEGLNEDLQADDGEYYKNADDFFNRFEADYFDQETTSPDRMEVRGYINGKCVMAWRYKSAKKIGGYGIYDDSALEQDVAECAMCEAGTCMEHGAFEESEDLGTVAEINQLIADGMHETDAIHDVAKKYGKNPSLLASFYYQNNRMSETIHRGTYGTEYDPSDEEKKTKTKHVPKTGQKGRPKQDKPAKANLPADPFGRTTGEVPKGKKGTKIAGKGNQDWDSDIISEKSVSKAQQQAAGAALSAKRKGETPKKGTPSAAMSKMSTRELEKFAGTKHKGLPKHVKAESLSESLAQVERKIILEANLKQYMETHHMTIDEMLECLSTDAKRYKESGHLTELLRDCMEMHKLNKPTIADEAKAVNYEVPAVQRKAAGEPPLSLGGVQADDTNRSMHPGMTKLDAPAPAQGVNPEAVRDELESIEPFNEELQKLAELAGLTMEHNDGNLANNYPPYDKVTQGDVVAGRLRHDQEGGDNIDEEELEEGPWEFKNAADNTKPGEHIEIDGNDTGRIKHKSASVNELRRLAGMPVDETGDDTLDEDDVEVDIGVDNDKPANTAHNDEYYSMRASTMGPGEGDPGEKRQFFNQPMTGDNRMSERVDQQLESRLTAEYESIKRQKQ